MIAVATDPSERKLQPIGWLRGGGGGHALRSRGRQAIRLVPGIRQVRVIGVHAVYV